MSDPVVGDVGLTWDQLRTVEPDRQHLAQQLCREMGAAHKRKDYLSRESLRRRLTSMLG